MAPSLPLVPADWESEAAYDARRAARYRHMAQHQEVAKLVAYAAYRGELPTVGPVMTKRPDFGLLNERAQTRADNEERRLATLRKRSEEGQRAGRAALPARATASAAGGAAEPERRGVRGMGGGADAARERVRLRAHAGRALALALRAAPAASAVHPRRAHPYSADHRLPADAPAQPAAAAPVRAGGRRVSPSAGAGRVPAASTSGPPLELRGGAAVGVELGEAGPIDAPLSPAVAAPRWDGRRRMPAAREPPLRLTTPFAARELQRWAHMDGARHAPVARAAGRRSASPAVAVPDGSAAVPPPQLVGAARSVSALTLSATAKRHAPAHGLLGSPPGSAGATASEGTRAALALTRRQRAALQQLSATLGGAERGQPPDALDGASAARQPSAWERRARRKSPERLGVAGLPAGAQLTPASPSAASARGEVLGGRGMRAQRA